MVRYLQAGQRATLRWAEFQEVLKFVKIRKFILVIIFYFPVKNDSLDFKMKTLKLLGIQPNITEIGKYSLGIHFEMHQGLVGYHENCKRGCVYPMVTYVFWHLQ